MHSLLILLKSVEEGLVTPPHINVITPGGVITGQLVTARHLIQSYQSPVSPSKTWTDDDAAFELAKRRLQEYADQLPDEEQIVLYNPFFLTVPAPTPLGDYIYIRSRSVIGWSYRHTQKPQNRFAAFIQNNKHEIYLVIIALLIILLISLFFELFIQILKFKLLAIG